MVVKNVEKKDNNTAIFQVEIDADAFEQAVNKAYKKLKNSIYVAGFRKGKAPRVVIEGMYGADIFHDEAVQDMAPEAFEYAVKEEDLNTVGTPSVADYNVDENKVCTITFTTDLYPVVTLGEYKGIEAPYAEPVVTDEEIDQQVEDTRKRNARYIDVERPVKEGDTIVFDFEGFVDGVPFEGGKAENHALELGSHSFVPGFEEGVVGLKPGDEKDIDVTFPEDYHADLAGKPVVFKIKVHEVKEPQAPVVDDEFAKDVSEFDTLDEFKKDLGDKLKERRQTQADRAYEDALMDQVVEALEVELPDAMVDYRAEQMVQDYAQRITSQGIPFEKYLEMTGQTMDRMKEQAKESAIKQIKYEMAMDAVAAAEGIVISDEELDAEYQSLADQYKMELDQVKALASAEDVRTTLLRRKAIDVVKDSAKVGKAKKPAAKKAAKETEDETAEEKPKKKAASKKRAETEQAPKTEE